MTSPDVNTPVYKYFDKDKPAWVKLGRYFNWLFEVNVSNRTGLSGTFALKLCASPHKTGKSSKSTVSADFWCSPIGEGMCTSILGKDEIDCWKRSVKYVESLRQKAIAVKSKRKKA